MLTSESVKDLGAQLGASTVNLDQSTCQTVLSAATFYLPMQLQAIQGGPLFPNVNVFSHSAISTEKIFKDLKLSTGTI